MLHESDKQDGKWSAASLIRLSGINHQAIALTRDAMRMYKTG